MKNIFPILCTAVVAATVIPAQAQQSVNKRSPGGELRNIASLDVMALHGSQLSFGATYERFISGRRWSVQVPMHFITSRGEQVLTQSAGGTMNGQPTDGYVQTAVRSPRVATYPGLKFYPGKNSQNLRYALGIAAMLEVGRYGWTRESFFNTVPEQLYLHEEVYRTRVRMGPLLSQSLNLFGNGRFYANLEAGVGAALLNTEDDYENAASLFAVGSMRFGFRF